MLNLLGGGNFNMLSLLQRLSRFPYIKKMRHILALVALIITATSMSVISARDLEKFMLRAYITDEKYTMIDSVEVSLFKNDTIPVSFKLLSGDDDQKLNASQELRMMVNSGMGTYRLSLYKDGFQPYEQQFTIASFSEDVKQLGLLRMKAGENSAHNRRLDEVSVKATRIKMVMKGDTMVYDAAAFQLAEGSMLEELVRQLDGVTLDDDGVITINGQKVNELLVNGKDFFQGDPKVALKNLPSYTVKNVKVYDKKADNAYLTGAAANIEDRDEDRNIVLDVNLKKEYNNGWMANMQAGMGNASRYTGRAFGMGYTDLFRITAFFNTNNVGNAENANTSGSWSRDWGASTGGRPNIAKGGIDYAYDDKKKIKVSGNATYTDERVYSRSLSDITQFYSTGDLYKRSGSESHRRFKRFSTGHSFNYNGSNVSIRVSPEVMWEGNRSDGINRSATFAQLPPDSYRGQALDSLDQPSYRRYMLTAMRQLTASNTDMLSLNLYTYLTLRPTYWKGYLSLTVSGSYSRNNSPSRTIYSQQYGDLADLNSVPVKSDRYSGNLTHRKNFNSSLAYYHKIRTMGEERARTIGFDIYADYAYRSSDSDEPLWLTDSVKDTNVLPSVVIPQFAELDNSNSTETRQYSHSFKPTINFTWGEEPLAPGDSTFNASVTTWLRMGVPIVNEHYDYRRPEIGSELLSQTTALPSSNLGISLQSTNKVRHFGLSLSLSTGRNPVGLSYLLTDRISSNPLVSYIPAEGGLKSERYYSAYANVYRNGRGDHHAEFNGYASLWGSTNSAAMKTFYDARSGMTIYQPANINGNWHAISWVGYSIAFLSGEPLRAGARLGVNYDHTVDYMTLDSVPSRNSVNTFTMSPEALVTYNFMSGSSVSLSYSANWQDVTSPVNSFNDFTTLTHDATLSGSLKLPWKLTFETKLVFRKRTGYESKAMNNTEWVWNASLEKSLLKGKLVARLEGVDLLNSGKDIRMSVNATGRVETWSLRLPTYGLFSLIYRLDMKPRSSRP